MDSFLTPSNVTFSIGIIALIFSVYKSYRVPQEDLEKKQALTEKDIGDKASVLAQKEVENKAALLAQQVEQERSVNEKRYSEFGLRLDSAMTLAQNHIHTVDVKVDNLVTIVNVMSNRITELSTIINERIPKK